VGYAVGNKDKSRPFCYLVLSFGITVTYFEARQAASASRFFSILARRAARSLRVKVH